jgi:hypothetical protein
MALLVQIMLNVNRGEHVSAFSLENVMEALGHREEEPLTPKQATSEELQDKFTMLSQIFSNGTSGDVP